MNRVQALKHSIAANQATLLHLQSLPKTQLVDDLIEGTKETIENARKYIRDQQLSKITRKTIDGTDIEIDSVIDESDLNNLLSEVVDQAVKSSILSAVRNRVALQQKEKLEESDRAIKQAQKLEAERAEQETKKQQAEEQVLEQKKLSHIMNKLELAEDKEEFVKGLPERWQTKLSDRAAELERQKQEEEAKRAAEELAIEMALLDEVAAEGK